MPVPSQIWFENPGAPHALGFAATNDGMGHPGKVNGTTGLPIDPLTPTLEKNDGKDNIRVVATQALPAGTGASIQMTEQTYSLMIHMSESLGVNCTFCHNTRAFSNWAESTPQRVTAYHGIQMARDLNVDFLDPLKDVFPANRLGPLGDSPKISCATCHQGVNKPLYGVSMAKDYPELGGQAAP
jgi:photosynthetic reaction center cytochrome c subunit